MNNEITIEISNAAACEILTAIRDSGVGKENLVSYLGSLESGLDYMGEKYEPIDCLYKVISNVIDDKRLLEWWLLYSSKQADYYPQFSQTPVIITSPQDLLDYYFQSKE